MRPRKADLESLRLARVQTEGSRTARRSIDHSIRQPLSLASLPFFFFSLLVWVLVICSTFAPIEARAQASTNSEPAATNPAALGVNTLAPPQNSDQKQVQSSGQNPVKTAPQTPASQAAPPAQPATRPEEHAVTGKQPSARQKRKAEEFYLAGVRAMDKDDVDAAEKDFARAEQADPTNREYPVDHEIARQHAITALIQSADKERILGYPAIAREKLAQAMALDPKNPEVAQHLDDFADTSLTAPPENDATASIAPPIELAPLPGKKSFHFRSTEPDVLRRVYTAFGITPTLDASVGGNIVHFDVDNVDFAHAAELVGLATKSFFVPLDPKRILVARDTTDNRKQFERVSVETLRLPGLTTAQMTDMGNIVRNLFAVQQATVQDSAGTITLRAPPAILSAVNRTFADLLDARSEVLLDVRILQVATTKTMNIGVQTPQTVTLFNVPSELNSVLSQNQSLVQQIISSGLANAGDLQAIAAILIASGQVTNSVLSQPFALFGGGLTQSGVALPAITANLALNSSDTRSLDQVQLRLEDKEEGTIRSGTKYPIVTSSYSSIAASSVNIPGLTTNGLSSSLAGLGVNVSTLSGGQPIPQVQYQDIGLTLKVTPTIERTDDVALNVTFTLTALEGSSVNGLPVLSNENYQANVVVGSGQAAMLMSNMSRQQSKAVTGLPGISELPGFQSTTNSQTELDVSNLVIVITPHLLRRRPNERIGPYVPLPRHS
jgi:general secretion pathway protein D